MRNPNLTLSDVIVATPVQINPHLQNTTADVKSFCEDYHIWLPNFDEYHTMAAYMFPRTSDQRLIAINILMDLLWFIDDYFKRERAASDQPDDKLLAAALKTGTDILQYGIEPAQKDVWHEACFALRERFIALNGEASLRRICQSLGEHLQASTLSLARVMNDGVLDVERYIDIREHDSGMQVAIDCIEFAYDIFLPESVMAHPAIVEMRRDCANVGGLINDLMSYHKEVQVGEHRFNLITVFMESQALPFEQAVHESVNVVNGFIENFLMHEQNLPDFGDASINTQVRLYVQGLKDHIGASWHWQLSTNRYRALDSPFEELRTLLPTG